MTSEILTVIVITAAALWLGYCLGFTSGNKRGRDLQWVEDFINAQKAERDRRDHAGRFKPKTK